MTECNFTVTPYLELEWVDEPYVDENNFLCCSVKFKRIEKEGMTMPDVIIFNYIFRIRNIVARNQMAIILQGPLRLPMIKKVQLST